MADKEILLSIQHLEQFFKMGAKHVKAVNDLSFDVPQGEIFAVVGDKGCGKTTLGKAITRKLNATGGSVYFHGLRICAGVRRYYEGIDAVKAKCKADVAELIKRCDEENHAATTPDEQKRISSKYKVLIERKKKSCKAECKRLTNEIIRAEYDHDHVAKEFAKLQQRAADAKYAATVPQAAKRQLSLQLAQISAAKDAERRKAMTEEQKEVIDVKYSVLLSQKEAELKAIAAKCNDGGEQQTALLKQYKRERQLAAKDKVANRIRLINVNALLAKKAIGAQTELLVVDSPAGIDATLEKQALAMLAELQSKGMTVLYATRNLSAVKDTANTVAILRNGSLVELADVNELFAHPCHPYTKSLLSGEAVVETHDYTVDAPMMREVADGHLVHCNQTEFEAYYDELHKPVVVEVQPEAVEEAPKTKKKTATKKTATAKKTTSTKKSTTSKSTAAKSTTKSTAKKSTTAKSATKSTAKKATTAQKKS